MILNLALNHNEYSGKVLLMVFATDPTTTEIPLVTLGQDRMSRLRERERLDQHYITINPDFTALV